MQDFVGAAPVLEETNAPQLQMLWADARCQGLLVATAAADLVVHFSLCFQQTALWFFNEPTQVLTRNIAPRSLASSRVDRSYADIQSRTDAIDQDQSELVCRPSMFLSPATHERLREPQTFCSVCQHGRFDSSHASSFALPCHQRSRPQGQQLGRWVRSSDGW